MTENTTYTISVEYEKDKLIFWIDVDTRLYLLELDLKKSPTCDSSLWASQLVCNQAFQFLLVGSRLTSFVIRKFLYVTLLLLYPENILIVPSFSSQTRLISIFAMPSSLQDYVQWQSCYLHTLSVLPTLRLMNNVWFKLLCRYSNAFIDMVNLPNHTRCDYFKPYEDFFNL